MTAGLPRRLLAVAVLATAALAQDGMRGTVRTVDGRSLTGALLVAEGKAIVREAAGNTELDLAALVGFTPDGAQVASAAPPAVPHRIWLRSGLELGAVRIGGKAAREGRPALVVFETAGGLVLDVPLASVRAIRHGGAERPEPALFAADLREPPSSNDLIYVVKDGKAQRSVVTVTAVTDTNVDFQLRGDAYEFELGGLAGVVFGANTGFPPDRQPKPRSRVALTTGEVIEGRLLTLDGTGLQCRLDEGCVVTVPVGRLRDVQIASDRLAWLSEWKPAAVAQTPAFDRTWPWTIDRTPAGPGFVLGGTAFARGLCLVPRTRLTWDLGGRYDRFEAMVGIDDRTGPEAHAIFRVLVDGVVAWESTPRTRGLPAEAVRVELKQAKTLALEVDFGKNYDLGDFCVFADARVVQQ